MTKKTRQRQETKNQQNIYDFLLGFTPLSRQIQGRIKMKEKGGIMKRKALKNNEYIPCYIDSEVSAFFD